MPRFGWMWVGQVRSSGADHGKARRGRGRRVAEPAVEQRLLRDARSRRLRHLAVDFQDRRLGGGCGCVRVLRDINACPCAKPIAISGSHFGERRAISVFCTERADNASRCRLGT
jgi:hypothetical protein